jgi:hypothetical protein
MTTKDADYWVGSLSMTVALAATDPKPKPLLRSVLRDFLADRPPGDELARTLRATLREAKP